MGGVEVTEHKYPWVVSLQMKKKGIKSHHFCTGSIISKTAILTAAHCPTDDYTKTYSVVFGTNDNRQTKRRIRAKNIIPHPQYDVPTFTNDAMIIILEKPIIFTKNVGPICLPDKKEIEIGQDIVMTGWGVSNSFDNVLIKNKIVKPPFDFPYRNWFKDDIGRKFLLEKFKSIVRDFNDMIDDNFKVLDADETKKSRSLVKFKRMLKSMNIELSDQIYLIEAYPSFLNWLLKNCETISKGLENQTSFDKLKEALEKRISSDQTNEPLLREAKAKKVDSSTCNYTFNHKYNLCMLPVSGVDEGSMCQGDSGGPAAALIDNQYVVVAIASSTIVSFPISCQCNCRDGNNDYEPSGYQKTQTIMDWIKITLKEYDALP